MDDVNEKQTMSPVPTKTTEVLQYSFIDALKFIIEGKKITKLEWGNSNVYGVLREGILMLHKDDDKSYQWILSEGDLLGDDWVVLPEGN